MPPLPPVAEAVAETVLEPVEVAEPPPAVAPAPPLPNELAEIAPPFPPVADFVPVTLAAPVNDRSKWPSPTVPHRSRSPPPLPPVAVTVAVVVPPTRCEYR